MGAVSLQSLQLLAAGDVAKVELDIEILKLMQTEHGGWNDGMATVNIGQTMICVISTNKHGGHGHLIA